MAFTLPDFYVRFPEFDLTDLSGVSPVPNTGQDALVTAAITGAEAQTDRTVFASVALADECIKYLAAHLLARAPAAMNMRLQKSRGDDNLHTGEDVYWPVYERLARGASSGYRST